MCAILMLSFIVGCDTEGSSKGLSTRTFVGGTDAIIFDFEPDSPPPDVYDGGEFPFQVVLRVTNAGEHPVGKADISFSIDGIPAADFGTTEAKLKGVSTDEDVLDATYIDSEGNQMPGTTTYVEIPKGEMLNFATSLRGNNPWTIRANACYKYRTQGQADLCVLADLKKREGKVCIVDEVKNVQSSSSPVLISNFRESVAGTNRISFSFDISKVGDGKISTPNPLGDNKCSTDHSERDKVLVKVDTGISKPLKCSALNQATSSDGKIEGMVTMFGGKRIITCTQEIDTAGGDYIKKVYIDVDFFYKDFIEKQILVKHTTDGTPPSADIPTS